MDIPIPSSPPLQHVGGYTAHEETGPAQLLYRDGPQLRVLDQRGTPNYPPHTRPIRPPSGYWHYPQPPALEPPFGAPPFPGHHQHPVPPPPHTALTPGFHRVRPLPNPVWQQPDWTHAPQWTQSASRAGPTLPPQNTNAHADVHAHSSSPLMYNAAPVATSHQYQRCPPGLPSSQAQASTSPSRTPTAHIDDSNEGGTDANERSRSEARSGEDENESQASQASDGSHGSQRSQRSQRSHVSRASDGSQGMSRTTTMSTAIPDLVRSHGPSPPVDDLPEPPVSGHITLIQLLPSPSPMDSPHTTAAQDDTDQVMVHESEGEAPTPREGERIIVTSPESMQRSPSDGLPAREKPLVRLEEGESRPAEEGCTQVAPTLDLCIAMEFLVFSPVPKPQPSAAPAQPPAPVITAQSYRPTGVIFEWERFVKVLCCQAGPVAAWREALEPWFSKDARVSFTFTGANSIRQFDISCIHLPRFMASMASSGLVLRLVDALDLVEVTKGEHAQLETNDIELHWFTDDHHLVWYGAVRTSWIQRHGVSVLDELDIMVFEWKGGSSLVGEFGIPNGAMQILEIAEQMERIQPFLAMAADQQDMPHIALSEYIDIPLSPIMTTTPRPIEAC